MGMLTVDGELHAGRTLKGGCTASPFLIYRRCYRLVAPFTTFSVPFLSGSAIYHILSTAPI